MTFPALSRVWMGTQGHPTGAIRGEGGDMITSSVLRSGALGRARATTVVCGIPVGRMEDLAG